MRAAFSWASSAQTLRATESEMRISAVKKFVFIDLSKKLWSSRRQWLTGKWSQKFQNIFGCWPAFLGVHNQRNAMRSGHTYDVRKGSDCGFHDVDPAQHRCSENVQTRIVLEQVF